MSNSHCLIVGECYPENISEWSQPVLAALEDCVGTQDSFDVDIELYTSTARPQSSFLISLNSLMTKQMRGQYVINWRYRAEDDTMQEAGEDFEGRH